MQGITYVLIIGFISPCLCLSWNVLDYGARGDGISDDSQPFLSAWNSACGADGESTILVNTGSKNIHGDEFKAKWSLQAHQYSHLVSPCLCVRWINVGTQNTYNVMDYGAVGDGKSDDTNAFSSAWDSACGAEGATTLVIPPQKLFLVTNLILSGTCKASSIHIELQGKIVAPPKAEWKDASYWIKIEHVNNLIVDGTGEVDGNGSPWWPCKQCERPKALSFHSCNNLTVSDLTITNSPKGHISINECDGAKFSNMTIYSPPLSPNTDGFDISASQNIFITDSTISVGDDCIAINGGCSNINATRIACGPGHGISIGSLGKDHADQTVEAVYVQNCTFNGTSNGARIKTWPGGSGYARKITFEQIQLIDVKNAIIIDQDYDAIEDLENQESAVQVSEVTYREFNGTCANGKAINLDCSSIGCYNITLDHIHIVSADPEKEAGVFCNYAHGVADFTVPNVPCLSKNWHINNVYSYYHI